jgi:hypothetical protein
MGTPAELRRQAAEMLVAAAEEADRDRAAVLQAAAMRCSLLARRRELRPSLTGLRGGLESDRPEDVLVWPPFCVLV